MSHQAGKRQVMMPFEHELQKRFNDFTNSIQDKEYFNEE